MAGSNIETGHSFHARYDRKVISSPGPEACVGADDIEILHRGEKPLGSSGHRSDDVDVHLIIITNKLAAAAQEKILTFCGLQHQRYAMLQCFRIRNPFPLEFIHQVAKFHDIAHNNRLLPRTNDNMSLSGFDRNIDSQHLADRSEEHTSE